MYNVMSICWRVIISFCQRVTTPRLRQVRLGLSTFLLRWDWAGDAWRTAVKDSCRIIGKYTKNLLKYTSVKTFKKSSVSILIRCRGVNQQPPFSQVHVNVSSPASHLTCCIQHFTNLVGFGYVFVSFCFVSVYSQSPRTYFLLRFFFKNYSHHIPVSLK